MNCLDFRRQLNIDPHDEAAEFARHRQECARCAEAHERALSFEQTLTKALHVPVPAQLADSILLAHATRQQQQSEKRLRRGGVLALAASILLGFGIIAMHGEAKPLPQLMVEHLNKEAFVLAMRQPVSDGEVRTAFTESGIALTSVPEGISFVYCCPVGSYHSVHLVMPEREGPVTVLYLVEDVVKQRENFVQDGWRGRAVPMAHGTLVLLARDSSDFDQIESSWRAALDSPISVAAAFGDKL